MEEELERRKEIGERLESLRLQLDKPNRSQQKVASVLGISDTAYQNYEHGKREIPGNVLIKLAKLHDVSLDYLLCRTDEPNPGRASFDLDDFVDIGVASEIAAGVPIDLTECDYTFPCPRVIAERHPNSRWYKVVGNSWNKKIPNGCLALVDFDRREPMNDRIPFAVCVNGYTATIKGVQKLENGYRLLPNSWDETILPITFDYNIDGTDEVTIMGEVVYATFPFDYEV